MKKFYLLIILCGSIIRGFGQSSRLSFDHITVDNGLPGNYINSILQDRSGYIWIATNAGLVRYDGYVAHQYHLGEGLSNTIINEAVSVFEDSKGTIVVGTDGEGLFIYDPHTDSFKFLKDDHNKVSLPRNIVYNITEGKNGLLWIFSGNNSSNLYSVNIHSNTKKIVNYSYKDKGNQFINAKTFTCLLTDKTGNTWLGSDNGFYKYNEASAKFEYYNTPADSGILKNIISIYQSLSEPGILWFIASSPAAKNGKLIRYDIATQTSKTFENKSSDAGSIAGNEQNLFYEDKKGGLWVATNNGISLLDRKTGKFKNYSSKDLLPGNAGIRSITEMDGHKFWLAAGNQLIYFDPENNILKSYKPDYLSDGLQSHVNQIIKDNENNLWVCEHFNGIDRLNLVRSEFNLYQVKGIKDGQEHPLDINRFLQISNTSCYISALQGLYLWDFSNNTYKKIVTGEYQDSNLEDMVTDDSGNLYIGANGGLLAWDLKQSKATLYKYLDGFDPKYSYVRSIVKDKSGRIWTGIFGYGLCKFDPATHQFTHYPFSESPGTTPDSRKLDDGNVNTVYADRKGYLWIGTFDGGLNRFNPKDSTFTSYYYINKAMMNVTTIFEDKQGNLWVGTSLNGLFLFDRGAGKIKAHLTEKNGLSSNELHGILQATDGKLWVSTSRGLSVIDPNNFNIRNYTTANGLPFGFLNDAAYQMKDGRMLFATTRGFYAFYPDKIKINTYPPQVHIESINYTDPRDTSPVTKHFIAWQESKLELPHNQNRLTFNYVALHYSNPALNQYKYQLAGFDHDWIKAGNQRSVTYNNLSPGSYTFKVEASNRDGVWNNVPVMITVIISSPWWYRWWAWLLYVFFSGVMIYLIVHYRSRHLLKENQRLEKKVTKRTEQLSKANEELADTLSTLKSAQTQLIQSEKMASLGELTAGIAHEIQNPLNFVNNFSELNVELIDEMQQEINHENFTNANDIADSIKENQQRINYHGKRAESIVKSMLQHSQAGKGEKQPTDINHLIDEFLKITYHGLRSKDKSFNAELIMNFDETIPKINVVQQDISKVLVNMFNNAFYAMDQKRKKAGDDYMPELCVATSASKGKCIIRVKDNGIGIPDNIKNKVMQPFFTTKPTGEGTGLGLSLSYDIVVKGHSGDIKVNTKEGEFTEFTITLPV